VAVEEPETDPAVVLVAQRSEDAQQDCAVTAHNQRTTTGTQQRAQRAAQHLRRADQTVEADQPGDRVADRVAQDRVGVPGVPRAQGPIKPAARSAPGAFRSPRPAPEESREAHSTVHCPAPDALPVLDPALGFLICQAY
jgi:hypothetical protein